MLSERDEILLTPRNEVVGATERTLTLRIGGREHVAPWSAVTGVSAVRARLSHNSDQWILVLAFEMETAGYQQLLLLSEIEPAWVVVTTLLPKVLAGIAPFEVWGAELLTASEPVELYQRAERLS